jgi:diacylglycerol kinase (ATP)
MTETNVNKPQVEGAGERVQMCPPVKAKSTLESFKYAAEGILDVFRTQKHMRFHFICVIIVLLGALLLDLDKRDMLIILFTVSMVLIAEMFNTAVEAVVDMVTQDYHPLAKFAKDAAAGAVLIATTASVLIAFMIFIGDTSLSRPAHPVPTDAYSLQLAIFTGVVLLVIVGIIKALSSKGSLLRGGYVSGHSAAGFFLATTILLVTNNGVAAVLAVLLAVLVAQSRVQAKIHTLQEVIIGALLAVLLTSVVYWFMPNYTAGILKIL